MRWIDGVTLIACLALAGTGYAQSEAGSVAEVTDCVSANSPSKSSVQEVDLVSTDRLGNTRTLDAKIYWKTSDGEDSKSLIDVEGPADLRGSKYLILEEKGSEQMWTYLPEYQKVRRIRAETMGGSLFGTDFSYEDFSHIRTAADRVRPAFTRRGSARRRRVSSDNGRGRPHDLARVVDPLPAQPGLLDAPDELEPFEGRVALPGR